MKNVLVVGASRGIGREIARQIPDDWNLWHTSRHLDETLNAGEGVHWDATADPFPADFLPDRLDGLVYCPGSIRLKPFNRIEPGLFIEEFNLNVVGAVRTIQAALPALKCSDHASVVLFSTVAVQTGMPMHTLVASAKGAIEGLTRSLAAELSPTIRVNAIAPSLTDTPLSSALLKTEKQRDSAASRHPLGRIGRADEIAALSYFLLSDQSAWITGQIIAQDGGMGTLRKFG